MITRLAELPLPQRESTELLALTHERVAPDGDYAGFGWCRLDAVVLPLLLARLPTSSDVVLALCNPGQVSIAAPPGAPRLHYGLGDVTSWLDHEPDGPRVRLSARRWEIAIGAP